MKTIAAVPVIARLKVGMPGAVATCLRAWGWGSVMAVLLTLSLVLLGEGAPGDLDPTFGVGGKVTTDFGGLDLAFDLVLQPDGKLVAAGMFEDQTFSRFALARYLPDGRLDPSFGVGGRVTSDFEGGRAEALVLQPDGKLVAAGFLREVARKTLPWRAICPTAAWTSVSAWGAGSPRTSGTMTAPLLWSCSLMASWWQLEIPLPVLAGTLPWRAICPMAAWTPASAQAVRSPPTSAALPWHSPWSCSPTASWWRRDYPMWASELWASEPKPTLPWRAICPMGAWIPASAQAGKLTTDFGGIAEDQAAALVLQPDGKLVAAGSFQFLGFDGTAHLNFALARYLPDGRLDPSFGTGGKLTTDFGGLFNGASALVLQPDGKLVAAGHGGFSETEEDFALVRYLPDGRLDPSFGTGGKLTTDVGAFSGASALVLQPDGKLVAAGFAVISDFDFALARYEGDAPLVREVAIDIKPGSSPNTINPKSHGVIPVAILTTEPFDATTVDPLSVHFGPNGATEAHGKGHIEDVNQDGAPDLVLHFRTQDTGIKCGDTSASLTGETFNEDPIQGSDSIKTVGCNK